MRTTVRPTFVSRPSLLIAACAIVVVGVARAMDPGTALNGDEELPPVKTVATGITDIRIGDDMSVTGTVETAEVDGIAAHIHVGVRGATGPIIITLNRTLANKWAVPVGTLLTPAQFANYKLGALYVNVDSAQHPSGEIRVQLTP